jgi:hypothetical protein
LLAIGCLERRKYGDVARLQLVRSVRGETAKEDIVRKAKL